MNAIIQKLIGSKGIQQSAITIIGNISATGLSAISLILISRILGPEKFGAFNIGFALVLIIIKLNDFGISAATIRLAASTSDKNIINSVFSVAIRYKFYLTALITPLGILASPFLAKLIRFDQPEIIATAFLFGIIATYYEQLLIMLQSIHLFSQAVVANAIQASIKLIMALALMIIGTHNVTLIFSLYIIAPISPILFIRWLLPKWVSLKKTKHTLDISRELKHLSLHFSLALLSAGIIENIDVFFIQRSLSTYETGLYSGVSRISMVFALIAYSMGNVLYPRVAKYKNKDHLQSYLKKAFGVVLLCFVGFLLFLPFAKWIIYFTIGTEYLSGLLIMNILVLSSFLAIASIPFIALFYSLNAHWYFSISAIFQLLIVLIGNFIFVPLIGLPAAAWTRLAVRLFLFIFTLITGLLLYKKQYVEKTETTFNHA